MPGTVLDLFDRDQYVAFHGHEPPSGWREATPQDIQAAAGGERPYIVFLSAPCKGFSGLLSEGRSLTDKYQALNRLARWCGREVILSVTASLVADLMGRTEAEIIRDLTRAMKRVGTMKRVETLNYRQ